MPEVHAVPGSLQEKGLGAAGEEAHLPSWARYYGDVEKRTREAIDRLTRKEEQ